METRDKLALAGIIAGIATPIIVTILTGIPLFKFYPNYDVSIESYSNDTSQREITFIKNKEMVQAKSASVFVFSGDDIMIDSFVSCIEGNVPDISAKKIQKIDFDRISFDIPCKVDFTSSPIEDINKIIITSEDAPGKVFVPSQTKVMTKTVESENLSNFIDNNSTDNSTGVLGNMFNSAFAQEKISPVIETAKWIKFELQKNTLDVLYQFVALTVSIEIGILGAYVTSRIVRKYKKQEKLKKTRQLIQEELDDIRRDLTELEKDAEIDVKEKEQINLLEKENINKIRKIQEIDSMMSSDIIYHSLIGQFFEKWIYFENNLFDIAVANNIDTHNKNTRTIVMKLSRMEILSPFFINDFEEIRQFRNHLAHGTIKKSKREIKEKIQELEKLQGIILDVFKLDENKQNRKSN